MRTAHRNGAIRGTHPHQVATDEPRDLIATVPLSRIMLSAAGRTDWQRRERELYAHAADLAIPDDDTAGILNTLITNVLLPGLCDVPDLFDAARIALTTYQHTQQAAKTAQSASPPSDLFEQISSAVRAMRDRSLRPPTIAPGDRTLGTAWARFTSTHPELSPRGA